MIFGLEIGMLIAGIMALTTGKFKLTKNRVAGGAAAQLAGLILVAPLPLSMFIGFSMGLKTGVQGKSIDENMRLTLGLTEAAITVGCLALGYLVAFTSDPQSPSQASGYRPQSEDFGYSPYPPEGLNLSSPRDTPAASMREPVPLSTISEREERSSSPPAPRYSPPLPPVEPPPPTSSSSLMSLAMAGVGAIALLGALWLICSAIPPRPAQRTTPSPQAKPAGVKKIIDGP